MRESRQHRSTPNQAIGASPGMLKPPRPEDEALRLAAVRALNLLDTPPEERFDRITRTAQRLFDVPVALLTLVDANRQWFKSCQGLSVRETDRDVSFCAHAILTDEPLVISDALLDPRFADNPLVTGEPFIRFYAGQPLHGTGGRRIGTLCIIDRQPRRLSADDARTLADLGHWAETELCSTDLSQALLLLRRSEARHQLLLDLAHQISAEGSAAGVLERALATAVALVEGDDAGIARWDDERAELVQVASFLPSASNGTALDLEATASGRVAQARVPNRSA
jgi:GAF domain-containing protein